MSVMFERFFGIPQTIVRDGRVQTLSGIATKVYMALCHESERYQTRELTRTVTDLRNLVGGSRNSHAKAREELQKAGLILAEPYGLEGYVFHLCDPKTGRPWPLHPREKALYKKKDTEEASQPVQRSPAARKAPKIESAGTSFPFGWNDAEQGTFVPTHQNNSNAEIAQPLNWEDIFSS